MERKRKAVDKGKSKSELASFGNIQSQGRRSSVKMEEDGSSSEEKAGSHSLLGMTKKARLGEVTGKSTKIGKVGKDESLTRESSHSLAKSTKKKDGSSLSIEAGAASPYHFSNFIGSHKQAGLSGSNSMVSCFSCKEFLNGLKNNHIPVRESGGAPNSLRQSVWSPQVRAFCEICCEKNEIFKNEACRHSICTHCISMHIQVRVSSNSGEILCPGLDCKVALTLDRCKELLPENVAESWEKMMIEMMIPESEKFYCPFKDCSGMLQNENEEEMRKMKESERPYCRRLFCVQCLVPWHSGMKCREFQRLNPDERGLREDIQMEKLAEKKKWMRCPQCKFYVEKISGCVFMKCRCNCEFCYRCGQKWSHDHGTCRPADQRTYMGYRP